MGRPLYPNMPHKVLGEKKEEPVSKEPAIETRVIDEVVNTAAVPEPEPKRFTIKNLRKKKDM